MIRVTVWNEYRHEISNEKVRDLYPTGIHGYIAEFLSKEKDFSVQTAYLDQPYHGLTDDVLDKTDVLIWWGHMAHEEVSEEIVEKVKNKVLCGMGFIALHSAHFSKVFKALMGTSCTLKWRNGAKERIWCCNPSHPIAIGVPEYFELPKEEMYGEFFDVPKPDELVFIGWFDGGEVFRSGITYNRGYGKVFYFQPGHETYPIFHDKIIQTIIKNAVRWARPGKVVEKLEGVHFKALE